MRYGDVSRYQKTLRGLWRLLRKAPANDRGIALILAITTLVVLTIVGVAALTNTSVELKVASSEKVFNIALYNADAGNSVAAEVLEEAISLRGLTAGSYKDSSGKVTVVDGGFWDEPMVQTGSGKTWIVWPTDYYDDQTGSSAYNQTEHNHDEDSASKDLNMNMALITGGGTSARADGDVDYLQFDVQSGGSILSSMGYEGVGKGVAGGGAKRVYGFAVRGDGPANTTGRVRIYATYDHII